MYQINHCIDSSSNDGGVCIINITFTAFSFKPASSKPALYLIKRNSQLSKFDLYQEGTQMNTRSEIHV